MVLGQSSGAATSALFVLDEGEDVGKRECLTTLAAGQQITPSNFVQRRLLGRWGRAGDNRGLWSVLHYAQVLRSAAEFTPGHSVTLFS